MTTKQAFEIIQPFIGGPQLAVLKIASSKGEEKEFFIKMVEDLARRIDTMPKTYEQDGKGDESVIYLHYFIGGSDWWITEKDVGVPEDPGQHQAFGWAHICEFECGCISIPEILSVGAELDLYWDLKTVGELKKERGIS